MPASPAPAPPREYGPADLIGATARHLVAPDRYQRLRRAIKDWLFVDRNRLPVCFLAELWPDIAAAASTVRMDVSHPFELPYGERSVLAAIAAYLRPATIFEFGTFTGTTTRLLADAAPAARVDTIDLPDEEMQWDDWNPRIVGRAFRDRPEYRGRITLHRCDSRRFNYTPFLAKCDLVFIDASHVYADVVHDSGHALDLVAPGGVIVWDDYQPAILGVVQALNELAARLQLVRVAHTRLAIHRPTPFAGITKRNPEPWARL